MKLKTAVALAALAAASALAIWRAREASRRSELNFFAMDTPVTLTAYGSAAPQALAESERAIRGLERELSVTASNSAIARLNAGERIPADSAAGTAIELSLKQSSTAKNMIAPEIIGLTKVFTLSNDIPVSLLTAK